MLGLQAKCKGTKLSYTQFSKMEGMLGKIKLTFQKYIYSYLDQKTNSKDSKGSKVENVAWNF